jgi:hypothetical protein
LTALEAEKILEDFRKTIKDLRPNSIVQSVKNLPYEKGKIKYAHFFYGEHIVKENIITKEMGIMLSESYGIVDSFFVEDPESINIKYREYIAGLKSGVITDFVMPNPFGECEPVLEFINFLNECLFKLGKGDMYTYKDGPLHTFVYNAGQKAAHKEKDLKFCIELANSRLTRTLPILDQKSDKELIFIK